MGFEGKIQTLVLMYVLFLIFKIKTHIYIFSKRYFIPIKWFQNQTQNGFEKGHGNW
jgi:Ca2+/H+ antiporter